MIAFGSGMSAAPTATLAAHEAAGQALAALQGKTPKLAIVFASASYPDVGDAARAVRSAKMELVEWDVSAHDWDTTNADLVATRVLANVRAGSIVLLHDGLDGDLDTDRSVVVRALPKILAGLRDLDLQPVRLDQLLHKEGYLATCS